MFVVTDTEEVGSWAPARGLGYGNARNLKSFVLKTTESLTGGEGEGVNADIFILVHSELGRAEQQLNLKTLWH